MSESPRLELGYVSRAHGLRGEVAVRTLDPASESLGYVQRLILQPRKGGEQEVSIASVRVTPKEWLLVLDEVETREASEALVGAKVFVYRDDLDAPGEGEFFQGDLIGLTAFDEAGLKLGTVEEIWSTSEVPNLVIRDEGKAELILPFADEFFPEVDMAGRRITVRKPLEEEA